MSSKCEQCGGAIVRMATFKGATIPLDAEPERETGDLLRVVAAEPEKRWVEIDGVMHLRDTYTAHRSTCPGPRT